jgi:hypothetical protein
MTSSCTITLTKSKIITETQELTITPDQIEAQVRAGWIKHFYGDTSDPDQVPLQDLDLLKLPFNFRDEVRFIECDFTHKHVHMYEPIRMVLGHEFALRWLFGGYDGYGPTQPFHCVDWALTSMNFDAHKQYKALYGNIQNFLTDYTTPGGAAKLVNEHLNRDLKPHLLRYEADHRLASALYKQVLRERLHELVDQIFGTGS